MLKIESKVLGYGIKLPNKREDITTELLASLVENINVSKYYCVIAAVLKTSLFKLINAGNTVKPVLIIAKINEEDVVGTSIKIGDYPIINRSNFERADHIYVNQNYASAAVVKGLIEQDKDLLRAITTGTFARNQEDVDFNGNSPIVYCIEYKVVPINQIVSCIDANVEIKNPFTYDI